MFGLAVYGDHLYWTDWLLRAVLRANKFTGADITYLKKNILRQPMGIVAVSLDANSCAYFTCRRRLKAEAVLIYTPLHCREFYVTGLRAASRSQQQCCSSFTGVPGGTEG